MWRLCSLRGRRQWDGRHCESHHEREEKATITHGVRKCRTHTFHADEEHAYDPN
jgi:hypothetical protein